MADVVGLDLSLDLPGQAPILARVEGVVTRLEDLTPAFELIRDEFRKQTREAFQTEGASTAGGRWKALSEIYGKRKEKKFPGKTILRREDALFNALMGGANAIEEIGRQEMSVGSAVTTPDGRWNLGTIHQEGTEDGRIPARSIINPTDDQRADYREILADFVWDED